MKLRFVKCLLAISALNMAAGPANAGTISSPTNGTSVTATGSFTVEGLGGIAESCPVSMVGTVESGIVGQPDRIVFNPSVEVCDSFYLEKLTIVATSSTQVTGDMKIGTTFGACTKNNFPFSWSGSTASRSVTTFVGLCRVHSITLTVSPTVTII